MGTGMGASTRADQASDTDAGEMLDGRYTIFGEIGCGGMATVHYGRLNGIHGFARPVAIKRLHPHLCRDPDFVAMFADEARVSACLAHANIVQTLDVVQTDRELAIVMEYVHGEALSTVLGLLLTRGEHIPVRIGTTIVAATLHALEAAHHAKNERGEPLMIVHRDVSPQNILIGADGVPRLLDFGIAKAAGRLRMTPGGELKGKLNYIAPEQLRGEAVSAITDVYGASVVLWEVLAGFPIFDGPNEAAILKQVFEGDPRPPSTENRQVPAVLDRIVMRGLSSKPEDRFPSAREMADALEREIGVVSQSELADWLQGLLGEQLAARREAFHRRLDTQSGVQPSRPATPASTPRPRGKTPTSATLETGPRPGTRRLDDPPREEPVQTWVIPTQPPVPTRVTPITPQQATAVANTVVSPQRMAHPLRDVVGYAPRRSAMIAGGLLASVALAIFTVFSGGDADSTATEALPGTGAALPALGSVGTGAIQLEVNPLQLGEPLRSSAVVEPAVPPIPARTAALEGAQSATNGGRQTIERASQSGDRDQQGSASHEPTKSAISEGETPVVRSAVTRRARSRRQRAHKKTRKPELAAEPRKASAAPAQVPTPIPKDSAGPSKGKKGPTKQAQTCVPVYEGQIKTYRCE